MRRSTTIWGPLLLITVYYAVLILAAAWVMQGFPQWSDFLPMGGIEELMQRHANEFAPMQCRRPREPSCRGVRRSNSRSPSCAPSC